MKHGRWRWWMGLLALALLAVGCGGPRAVAEEAAVAFADEVAPLTERLLQALSEGDEAAYIADMTQPMVEASSGERFTRVREQIWGTLGDYESAEMSEVLRQKQYWSVIYKADFAEEADVTVRVVYEKIDDAYRVTGLWFDSPKLRAAQ